MTMVSRGSTLGRVSSFAAVAALLLGSCVTTASILKNTKGDASAESEESAGDQESLGVGGSLSVGESCISVTASEVKSLKPVDIIFVIDNSGSMNEELEEIEKNINDNFANVMDAAGLDYRVIMVVQHNIYGFCVEAPLSTVPKGGCEKMKFDDPPGNNPGKFYHYSVDVQSNDSPCIILDTLKSTNYYKDYYGLAPNGWIDWLRPSAFKVFIEVTDDMAVCTWNSTYGNKKKKTFGDFYSSFGGMIMAQEWDKALTTIAPEHFGTPENRNYTFFSVVGMMEKPEAVDDDTGIQIDPAGKVDDAFVPPEGIVGDNCSTAIAPGHGYQQLSKLTNGLRFPVCQGNKFDVIFKKIANSIESITTTQCTIKLPDDGKDGSIDVESASITIEKNDGKKTVASRVDGLSGCSSVSEGFYVDESAGYVMLCPDLCSAAKLNSKGIVLSAGCNQEIK